MKIISPKIHAVLDYLTFFFLLAAPSLFSLSEFAVTFCYMLAGIYLLITIMTNFNGQGVFKVIPFRIHLLIEFFLALFLGVCAFTYFRNNTPDNLLFSSLGVVILIVFLITDYKKQETKSPA